eukprot:CAMPEP_0117452180 /NCGR_PEP_ID=MMETSP0759-20121206/9458_1 /TAXON_ID=63605 /ORGANISM="Percolomonas cosmopolitus, Strain WS" /LENGTH=448 /DNA_ID=CAMNT_0005244939 /DNA_START=148 /DNA_END=1490 /DNA_ORIENTATION=+
MTSDQIHSIPIPPFTVHSEIPLQKDTKTSMESTSQQGTTKQSPAATNSAPKFVCPVTGQSSDVNPHAEKSSSETPLACPVSGQSASNASNIPSVCPYAHKTTTKFYNERYICRHCDLYAYEPVLEGVDQYVCRFCWMKKEGSKNQDNEAKDAPKSEHYDFYLMKSALEDQWAHAMLKRDPRYKQLGPVQLVSLSVKKYLQQCALAAEEALGSEESEQKVAAHDNFILILDILFDKSSFYLQNALSFSKVGNRDACLWYLEEAFSYVDMVLQQLKEYKDKETCKKLLTRFLALGGVVQGLLGQLRLDPAEKRTHLDKSILLLNEPTERDDDILDALTTSYRELITVASDSEEKLTLYKKLIAVHRELVNATRNSAQMQANAKLQLAQTLMHQGAEQIRCTKKLEAHKAYTDSLRVLKEVENNMFFLPNSRQVKQRIEDTRNLISEKLNS